jgi:hypothetical protein
MSNILDHSPLRVAIAGSTGRMGQMLLTAVAADSKAVLGAARWLQGQRCQDPYHAQHNKVHFGFSPHMACRCGQSGLLSSRPAHLYGGHGHYQLRLLVPGGLSLPLPCHFLAFRHSVY